MPRHSHQLFICSDLLLILNLSDRMLMKWGRAIEKKTPVHKQWRDKML